MPDSLAMEPGGGGLMSTAADYARLLMMGRATVYGAITDAKAPAGR